MSHYTLKIPGQPYPLKRARRALNGRMFDPVDNRRAKENIAWHARTQFPRPLPDPVDVTLHFWFERPKSHFGKRGLRKSAPLEHAQKPDVDNLIKAVLDGLNQVAWLDDTQVVQIRAMKSWTTKEPHTWVQIATR